MSDGNSITPIGYTYTGAGDLPLRAPALRPTHSTSLLNQDLQLVTRAWLALFETLLTKWKQEQEKKPGFVRSADSSPPKAFSGLRRLLQEQLNSVPAGKVMDASQESVLDLATGQELICYLGQLKAEWTSQYAEPLIDSLVLHASAGHNQQVYNENAVWMIKKLSWMTQPGSSRSNTLSGTLGVRFGLGLTFGISGAGEQSRSETLGKGGVLTEEFMKAAKLAVDVRGGIPTPFGINTMGTTTAAPADAGVELSGRRRTGVRLAYASLEEYAASQSPLHLISDLKSLLVHSGEGSDPLQRHINQLNRAHGDVSRLNDMLSVIRWPKQTTRFVLPKEGERSTVAGYTGELKLSAGIGLLPNKGRLGASVSAIADATITKKDKLLSFLAALDPSTVLSDEERQALDDKIAKYDLPQIINLPKELDALAVRVGSVLQLMQLSNGFFGPRIRAEALATVGSYMREEQVKSIEDLFGKWSAMLYLYLQMLRKKDHGLSANAPHLEALIAALDAQLAAPRSPYDREKLDAARGLIKTTTTKEEKFSAVLQIDLPGFRGKLQASWKDNESNDPTQDGEVLEVALSGQVGANVTDLKDTLSTALKEAFPDLPIKLASVEWPLQGTVNLILYLFKPRTGEDVSFRLQETMVSLNAISTFGLGVTVPVTPFIGVSVGGSTNTTLTRAEPKRYAGQDMYWLLRQYFNEVAEGKVSWGKFTADHGAGLEKLRLSLLDKQGQTFVDLRFFLQRYGLYKHENKTVVTWEGHRTLYNLEKVLRMMAPHWKKDKADKQ